MPDGLLNLSTLGYVGAALALTHVTIAAVTIFLHRHQAHNALSLHPVASHFFRFWLWLTAGIVTKEWVAVHRKHHAVCETAADPHSPQTRGIWRVLLGGLGLYRDAARDPETLERYGRGTPDDWLERRVYSRSPWLGIGAMASLDLLLFGAAGLAIFAVQMLWIPFWAAGVINGLGHFWGYRNFETPNASRNLSPIGILIGGEELHNNHHAWSHSARLSNRWWELDVGWWYIKALSLLGLARPRRVSPKVRIARHPRAVDLQTVRALSQGRHHILTLYARKVIRPVVRAEGRASRGARRRLLRRARKLMSREDLALDAAALAALSEAIAESHALATVYRYKTELKALWAQAATDGTDRVERVKAWCAEAERSGITALQDFADTLRAYTLRPA